MCAARFTRASLLPRVWLEGDAGIAEPECHGEWMGFLRVRAGAVPRLRELVAAMIAEPAGRRAGLSELLNRLVAAGEKVRVIYTTGHWLDVDSVADVLAAGRFA